MTRLWGVRSTAEARVRRGTTTVFFHVSGKCQKLHRQQPGMAERKTSVGIYGARACVQQWQADQVYILVSVLSLRSRG